MSEKSIVQAKATVMVYNNEMKKWEHAGGSQGISSVHVYYNSSSNSYRIVGRKLADSEVVINCVILRNLKYNKATTTFHQWRDQRQVYGLNFQGAGDAQNFSNAVFSAIENLNNPQMPPQHNGGVDDFQHYKDFTQNPYSVGHGGGTIDRSRAQDVPQSRSSTTISMSSSPVKEAGGTPPSYAPAASTPPSAPHAPAAPPPAPTPLAAPPAPPAPPPAPAAPPAPPASSAPPPPPSGGPPPPPPPPPPPGGGPPPPPPPPSSGGGGGDGGGGGGGGGGGLAAFGGAGGLAAALQAKAGALKKSADTSSEPSKPSGGGGGGGGGGPIDMMSEMNKMLAKRRQRADNSANQTSTGPPSDEKKGFSLPEKITPKPTATVNTTSKSKLHTEPPPTQIKRSHTNSANQRINRTDSEDSLSQAQLKTLKAEIIAAVKSEFETMKEELLNAIREELSGAGSR